MAGNNLRFISLAIKSYAGIHKKTDAEIVPPLEIDQEKLKNVDPDNGLMIVFPDGYRTTVLEGNQGLGKTSFLNAIREVCGGDAPPAAVNTLDDDKKIKGEFIGKDGKRYTLSITKTSVVLKELILDDKGNPLLDQKGNPKVMDVKSPKTQLAELIGPAGVSPLWLANVKGEKQIEWLRSMSVLGNDIVTFETSILPKIKETTSLRKQANATYKQLKGTLANNEYYNNWEHYEQYFNNDKQFETVDAEFKEVEKRKDSYKAALTKLETIKLQKESLELRESDIKAEIARLTKELETVAENIGKITSNIEIGEQFIEDNKNVEQEYNQVLLKKQDKAVFSEKKKAWDQMKGWKLEMDTASDEVIRLTGKLNEYLKLKQEMIRNFTPKVEGLEVCVPGAPVVEEVEAEEINDEPEIDTRHGLYYQGKPLFQLAESELWEMFAGLCRALNIKVILVENINGLGTGAVEKFNEFINDGGYVFATMMNRQQKALRISWNTQIPD